MHMRYRMLQAHQQKSCNYTIFDFKSWRTFCDHMYGYNKAILLYFVMLWWGIHILNYVWRFLTMYEVYKNDFWTIDQPTRDTPSP